ncbi:MAG: hypothetical protein Q4C88_00670 [Akkermansia sp.]|nr:hypothetical protein [Akkermansia sp.]
MPDSPESDTTPAIPEVSTEAARQALDAMSEQLVQKLNRMIEEQEARVQAFAVQNPSLSSLPVTPKPIEVSTKQPEAPRPRVLAPASAPLPPVPAPQQPSATGRDITPEEAIEKFERMWEQNKRQKREQERNKPKRPAPAEKKETNFGFWIFFIVVVLILMRACSE